MSAGTQPQVWPARPTLQITHPAETVAQSALARVIPAQRAVSANGVSSKAVKGGHHTPNAGLRAYSGRPSSRRSLWATSGVKSPPRCVPTGITTTAQSKARAPSPSRACGFSSATRRSGRSVPSLEPAPGDFDALDPLEAARAAHEHRAEPPRDAADDRPEDRRSEPAEGEPGHEPRDERERQAVDDEH